MRLRELRLARKMSQQRLAIELSMSQNTISRYENGEREPGIDELIRIADYFNVSLDYLLYGEKSRTLPLQKMSENRVQLLTDLAQEFAAPTSHGAAFSDRKLDILRRLYQEFYR